MTNKTRPLNFIDVFSGAGGLSCGLEMTGMKCLLGIDMDKYAMKTFDKNHKDANIFCDKIENLSEKKLKELVGNKQIHAVVGGPPCQGFSTVGTGNPTDVRNKLFLQFLRLVKITNPYFVVIENVTGLLATKNEKTLISIFQKFSMLGYKLNVQVMSAQQYGAPEKRRRTIIIGTRINETAQFPKITHDYFKGKKYIPAVTVGDAFKSLSKKKNLANHEVDLAKLKSEIDIKRLKRIPEGKGIRYEKDEKAYFTKSLKLGVDWTTIREGRFRQTKYQRLDRSKPSPTIMTHRHSYFHPIENRYLTQREAAKLQSFPDNFEFVGPITAQWRQIGNAVPPLLGKAIGTALNSMYDEYQKKKELQSPKKLTNKKSKEIINDIRKSAFVYKRHKTPTC